VSRSHASSLRAGAVGLALALGLPLLLPSAAQNFERRRGFSVAITEPANQEVVFGKTRIVAEVEVPEPGDLDRVEFLVGDTVVFVDREPPYECFHEFTDEQRSHIIRAIAYHREGLTVEDAIITRKMTFGSFEEVNRVILWVSVTDREDEFVTDLEKDRFELLENGERQTILELVREERPITMAILLDSSGSMREELEDVHDAAQSFVDTLRDEDRAMVVYFDDKVFLIQPLTSDRDELKASVSSTEAIGGTSLYDAIHATYRTMRGIQGRKAIIVLSDGDDSSSRFSFRRILQQAKASNTMIYTIGLGAEIGASGRGVLRDFAEFTGGRAFFVRRAEDLAGVYQRIAEELRSQFYLTYSTSVDSWDGRWVKLEVTTDVPGHTVRARRGFFAVRTPDRGAPPTGDR
jgi:Ca-activated chloride channel family protein